MILNKYEIEREELVDGIEDLTKTHIVERAEKFWDEGTELIASSNFVEARKYFAMASQYYARASQICSEFIELRLYLALSKITYSSSLEAYASELYRRNDQPLKASKLFVKAYETMGYV